MRFSRLISTIDTHTEGEPTRTVIGGIPRIPGKTMGEKMLYFRDNLDSIRQALMFEPRGHGVMSGAILTEPCDPEADVGVIYIETGGYLPMCGHDTIGCCTALVEAGMVPVKEGMTEIKIDTPAGLVTAKVLVKDGSAKEVTFCNVPSFVYMRDATVRLDGGQDLTMDIAYGGNFFGILEASKVGLEIRPERAGDIIRIGNMIREATYRQIRVVHPEMPHIDRMTHVEFYGEPEQPGAHVRNAVVFPPGQIDRSPCGTGTSARLAALHARGEILVGQEFVHESILGSLFRSRILEETTVGGLDAVVPEVTGSAWVTGINTWVIDPSDPLKYGYLLGA
jgi:proline racemase